MRPGTGHCRGNSKSTRGQRETEDVSTWTTDTHSTEYLTLSSEGLGFWYWGSSVHNRLRGLGRVSGCGRRKDPLTDLPSLAGKGRRATQESVVLSWDGPVPRKLTVRSALRPGALVPFPLSVFATGSVTTPTAPVALSVSYGHCTRSRKTPSRPPGRVGRPRVRLKHQVVFYKSEPGQGPVSSSCPLVRPTFVT